MKRHLINAEDVDSAREQIFDYIRRHRYDKYIYFNGWSGFGAAPVLRSLAQELWSIKDKKTPPELCFDIIIYIDCSAWKSVREMQRKIAEELQLLDHETMAMFDKQDEEDDFKGVDYGSRDVIPSVSRLIVRTLFSTKFMMIFLNGSDEEIDVNKFGINPDLLDHAVVWTFKKRSLSLQHERGTGVRDGTWKLRYTHLFVEIWEMHLSFSQFSAVLREEAAIIVDRHPYMRGIDLTTVADCFIYKLFLQYAISFNKANISDWEAHAFNYWTCDGIIKVDGTRETRNTLHQEIRWEWDGDYQVDYVFKRLTKDPEAPFLVLNDNKNVIRTGRPYRWICITSLNQEVQEDVLQTILGWGASSSLFIALEKSNPQGFPNGFFKHCNNLSVLFLAGCAFSFVWPPFLQCHGLRFLGLDHCTHDKTTQRENNANWACLQNLWVLDLRNTKWDDILSEEKMDILANLRELNIEGFICWQLATRLHGRLPSLQRLRIIKPTHKADTSIDTHNLFMEKTGLEILDLSGNTDMKNLSISSSMARRLQMLILDGCSGLKTVVVPDGLPSSLRFFSFDGGPTPRLKKKIHFLERMRGAKTSKVSLQGCTQLENLFVGGLPNLVELELSGVAIKALDLDATLVDVPGLKRLFLLGCKHLRAIKWGSVGSREQLELLCIDTRPGRAHRNGIPRPPLVQHRSFRLQLHAILVDARLGRSLYDLMHHYTEYKDEDDIFFNPPRATHDIYFNIQVTSSAEYDRGVQLEAMGKEISGPSNQQHHVLESRYGDVVLSKIGDAPMLVFPQPPTHQLDHHIEIGDGSCGLESELTSSNKGLAYLMSLAGSLHLHDASTSASMPGSWECLKWCRMERCPKFDTVFSSEAEDRKNTLETIWASDLQMARCIWSKGTGHGSESFGNLQHLHLRSCPRLQFVLPVWVSSFPSLKTLHIIHCGDLRHVFVLNEKYPKEIVVHGVSFPKLTTIHLHDLPKLEQICEVKMLAPALEIIRIRGCFGLRRLPALQGREPGLKKPSIEMEKDVWDALEWDGLAASHQPDLFEPPVHSRYFRQSHLLRGTVLR